MTLAEHLYTSVWDDPIARELVPVLTSPTGTTTAGFPYLQKPAWERFRDWVPHILDHGPKVLAATARLEALGAPKDAVRVVRQVVNTAAVTAPPDLWLLRHVFAALHAVGILELLRRGAAVVPEATELDPRELDIDLQFLLSRGYLMRRGDGYRLAENTHAHRAAEVLGSLPVPAGASILWRRRIRGEAVPELARLAEVPTQRPREPGLWVATPEEIDLGYRLVPLLVALRGESPEMDLDRVPPEGRAILAAAGMSERLRRRGPGPFGIIEAYHPYMAALPRILRGGRGGVHVNRATNIAASQDANRRTFTRGLDALDRFCADTGFQYDVFIEHALGRGEATRQRFERGPQGIHYVGADLEDAAIDAAMAQPGMPPGMIFVRGADIGRPDILLKGMGELNPEGAVMIVGNGFHEVREQTDARMTAVLRAYEQAGLLLLFTEESALSVEALLHTAWNTYHAGFSYVHARSGQGLRPAIPEPPSALGGALPKSWTECAEDAGYVRATKWCVRSRTIFPYTPPSGHNPAISVTHFFVPSRIAARLGLS